MRPRIDILVDYFLPGYMGGGIVRATANFVRRLRSDFDLRVVTRDHDYANTLAYSNASRERVSNDVGCSVVYVPKGAHRLVHLKRILGEQRARIVYLNSAFSPWFTLLPLWLMRSMRDTQV